MYQEHIVYRGKRRVSRSFVFPADINLIAVDQTLVAFLRRGNLWSTIDIHLPTVIGDKLGTSDGRYGVLGDVSFPLFKPFDWIL